MIFLCNMLIMFYLPLTDMKIFKTYVIFDWFGVLIIISYIAAMDFQDGVMREY